MISQGRAETSEKKALLHAAKADAINSFLIDKLLRQAAPENNPVAKKVTLQEILDRASAQVGASFPGQPEVEADIRLTLGKTYHDLGDYAKSGRISAPLMTSTYDKPMKPGKADSEPCMGWVTAWPIWGNWRRQNDYCSMRSSRRVSRSGQTTSYHWPRKVTSQRSGNNRDETTTPKLWRANSSTIIVSCTVQKIHRLSRRSITSERF